MKKILFSAAAVCAAGLAMATSVESPNTFGVLKVSSTNAETVVSVPWEAVGTSDNPIKVKDFVMTSNMTAGDTLYLYNSSTETYKGWVLTEEAGVKSWVGLTSVTSIGGKSVSQGGEETLARGQALIICRGNYNNGATPAGEIYLYGQYTSTGVGTYTLAAGKATLFAPVNTTSLPFYLNRPEASEIASGTTVACVDTWTNVEVGDTIRLQDKKGNSYIVVYNGTSWIIPGTDITAAAIIQPGMGAWYMSTGQYDVTFTTTTVDGSKN